MDNCQERDGALHLMGLLSDGGVHSHITHLFALLEMAKKRGLGRVYVHCFLDGRDVPPASGKGYVEQLVDKLQRGGRGPDRHRHGPLLRHGPGQALGPGAAGL